MPIVKNSGFFTHRRRMMEKVGLSGFWGWVFCLSTIQPIHRTSDLHAKTWIISRRCLRCAFWGSDPKITEPQWGPPNPKKNFDFKNVFIAHLMQKKIADFNGIIISKSDKNWRRYRKKFENVITLCLIRFDSLTLRNAKLALLLT